MGLSEGILQPITRNILYPIVGEEFIPTDFVPTDISQLNLWLDASDETTITETDNLVSQIDDKSEQGNNFTQAVTGAKPKTRSLHNGKNVLDFDGVDDVLSIPSITLTTSFSLFITFKPKVVTLAGESSISYSSTENFQLGSDSAVDYFGSLASSVASNATPSGGPYNYNYNSFLLKFDADANRVEVYVNGELKAASIDYNTDMTSGGTMKLGLNRSEDRWLNFSLAEVIIYNKKTNASEEGLVFNYLKDKWAIERPSEIADTLVWLDAGDVRSITESGNAVSQINDRSGNNNHFTQATGANQPTTNLYTHNYINTLRFDGIAHFLEKTSLTIAPNSTFYMVVKVMETDGIGDSILSADGTNDFQFSTQSSVQYLPRVAANVFSGFSVSEPYDYNFLLFGFKFNYDTNTATMYLNGEEVGSANDYNTLLSNNLHFRIAQNRSGVTFYEMLFGELIIIDRATTEQEDADINNYLLGKWAILDPRTLDQVSLIYDASNPKTITEVAGEVSQLDSLATEVLPLVQGTSTDAPITNSTTQNNLNTLNMVEKFMIANGYTASGSSTIYFATKPLSTGIGNAADSIYSFNGSSGIPDVQIQANQAIRFDYATNAYLMHSNLNAVANGPYQDQFYTFVYLLDSEEDTAEIFVNNVSQDKVTDYARDLGPTVSVRLGVNRTGSLYRMPQEFGEWIIVRKASTEADRKQIWYYLKAKWQIEA